MHKIVSVAKDFKGFENKKLRQKSCLLTQTNLSNRSSRSLIFETDRPLMLTDIQQSGLTTLELRIAAL